MKLSIITPTYNRANMLGNLYKSIVKNLEQDEEVRQNVQTQWLVIDDGSTDNTEEVINQYIHENVFEIQYHKQENQGKMAAINHVIHYANGDLIVECDSDDIFSDTAFYDILQAYNEAKKRDDLYGLCFLKYDIEGNNIGNTFQKEETTMFDLYFKQGEDGEKALVYNAKIRKQFSYELENNERFVTEARMYHKIDEKYKMICVNKPIMICEYQEQGYSKKVLKKKRFHQKIILSITAIVLLLIFIVTNMMNQTNRESITVGSKDFTEQNILCHMVSDVIEDNTDIVVNRSCNLGGTQICFGALQKGNIDLYIDYTGTVYGDTLKYTPINDIDKVYQTVKKDMKNKYHIAVLDQMGFNNTYALAVRSDTKDQYQLRTMSDLARVSNQLVISPSLEFINRQDGLAGATNVYHYQFKDIIGIDGSPRYTALINHESDVIDAFSTDGLLKKFQLTVLEDDQHFFPPYYAIPMVREDTLEKYPEIKEILNKLGTQLNNDIMRELNYQVDELGKSPEKVATDFLNMINLTV